MANDTTSGAAAEDTVTGASAGTDTVAGETGAAGADSSEGGSSEAKAEAPATELTQAQIDQQAKAKVAGDLAELSYAYINALHDLGGTAHDGAVFAGDELKDAAEHISAAVQSVLSWTKVHVFGEAAAAPDGAAAADTVKGSAA